MDSKSSTPVNMPLDNISVSPPSIQRTSALYFMDREREEAEAKEKAKEKRQTNEHDGQFIPPESSQQSGIPYVRQTCDSLSGPPILQFPDYDDAPLRRERGSDYGLFTDDFKHDLNNYLHFATSKDLFELIKNATIELENKFWSLSPLEDRKQFVPPPPPMAGKLGAQFHSPLSNHVNQSIPHELAQLQRQPSEMPQLQRQSSVLPRPTLERQSNVAVLNPNFHEEYIERERERARAMKNSDATHIDVGDEGDIYHNVRPKSAPTNNISRFSISDLDKLASDDNVFATSYDDTTTTRNMKDNDIL